MGPKNKIQSRFFRPIQRSNGVFSKTMSRFFSVIQPSNRSFHTYIKPGWSSNHPTGQKKKHSSCSILLPTQLLFHSTTNTAPVPFYYQHSSCSILLPTQLLFHSTTNTAPVPFYYQ